MLLLRALTARAVLLASTACAVALVATPLARADEGQTLRQAVRVQLLSPAISSDGRRVAVASLDPAGEPAASGSLAIFDAGGQPLRRIPLVSPKASVERARSSHAEASKLLDEGAFRRMGRVRRTTARVTLRRAPSDPPPSFVGTFRQGEFGFGLTVSQGAVRVDATRATRRLGSVTFRLGPERSCREVQGYSVSPGRVGFETDRRVLAFSITAEDAAGGACFSHDFVVAFR